MNDPSKTTPRGLSPMPSRNGNKVSQRGLLSLAMMLSSVGPCSGAGARTFASPGRARTPRPSAAPRPLSQLTKVRRESIGANVRFTRTDTRRDADGGWRMRDGSCEMNCPVTTNVESVSVAVQFVSLLTSHIHHADSVRFWARPLLVSVRCAVAGALRE